MTFAKISAQAKTHDSSKVEKGPWVPPQIEVIRLHVAEGSLSGPKCDKHGSLSTGGGCD